VLDVLLLLSVSGWLLEGFDDEGGGGWDDRYSGLTVLDGQSNGDTETLPVASGFGDIFTDFLGRKTERTNLGSERGRSTDFATGCPQVDYFHLIWVEFWRHCERSEGSLIELETEQPWLEPSTTREILTLGYNVR